MNAYIYHMLLLARDTVDGRATTANGEAVKCPFCTADEAAVFKRNFQARPTVPDCSHCPLLTIKGVNRSHLEYACATVGKIFLHLFETYFERGESAWQKQ